MRILLLVLIGAFCLSAYGSAQGGTAPPPAQESVQQAPPPAEPASRPASSWRDLLGRPGVLFLVLLGLLFCFFGQPWLKVLLGVTGLLIGAATGYTLAAKVGFSGQILVGAAIAGGAAGALIALFLFWLSLFALGAGFGGVLFLLVLMALGKVPATTAAFQEPALLLGKLPLAWQVGLAVAGVAGGLVTIWLQRFLTVVATAFCGSLLLVVNLLSFTEWGRQELDRLEQMAPGGRLEFRWDALLLLAGWLFLGLLGVFFQLHQLARRPAEAKQAAPPPPAAQGGAASGQAGGRTPARD